MISGTDAEKYDVWNCPTADRATLAGTRASVTIAYQLEPDLTAAEFIDILVRSTLAERRPINRPDVIQAMLEHADVIVTARVDEQLVGVSRAISDFSYCTYLSDLAVDQAHQRQGIGRELIKRTHDAGGVHTHLILLAAPKARAYYPHIGMDGPLERRNFLS